MFQHRLVYKAWFRVKLFLAELEKHRPEWASLFEAQRQPERPRDFGCFVRGPQGRADRPTI